MTNKEFINAFKDVLHGNLTKIDEWCGEVINYRFHHSGNEYCLYGNKPRRDSKKFKVTLYKLGEKIIHSPSHSSQPMYNIGTTYFDMPFNTMVTKLEGV